MSRDSSQSRSRSNKWRLYKVFSINWKNKDLGTNIMRCICHVVVKFKGLQDEMKASKWNHEIYHFDVLMTLWSSKKKSQLHNYTAIIASRKHFAFWINLLVTKFHLSHLQPALWPLKILTFSSFHCFPAPVKPILILPSSEYLLMIWFFRHVCCSDWF